MHFCNTFDDNNCSVSSGFVRFHGKGLPITCFQLIRGVLLLVWWNTGALGCGCQNGFGGVVRVSIVSVSGTSLPGPGLPSKRQPVTVSSESRSAPIHTAYIGVRLYKNLPKVAAQQWISWGLNLRFWVVWSLVHYPADCCNYRFLNHIWSWIKSLQFCSDCSMCNVFLLYTVIHNYGNPYEK